MEKNRKTVRKGFTYLQCDDFAEYLSQMAAQGWHFKEWGVGLVFEKGEPEQAVYAVEVFIHGSEFDLRPDDHTLNFSDYCEEAGWKLIDAKGKFCIFKQTRADAVPIVTPEERLNNASNAYRKQLGIQVFLSVTFIGNLLLRFLPKYQLIESLFSNLYLLFAVFYVYHFTITAAKCIWYLAWLRKAKKCCNDGESRILSQAKNTFLDWINALSSVIFVIGMMVAGGPVSLIIFIATTALILIPTLLIAKFRPDRETFISFQIVYPIILVVGIIFTVFFFVATSDSKDLSHDACPLVYEDLGYNAGNIKEISHSSSASIFGSKSSFALQYEKDPLSYMLYETDRNWILDIAWEYEMSKKWNTNVTDCTSLWNADIAYQNTSGGYIIRYSDAILILNVYDGATLSEEQVDIILDALGLEG